MAFRWTNPSRLAPLDALYHNSRYTDSVPRAVSVRLDDDAERALRALQATGKSRSDAIRDALLQSAARLQRLDALRAEVAALENDRDDRQEMLAVAALMEDMRASG